MASFDDMPDAELAAACNRPAAWVERLPKGAPMDPALRLTERNLALILRQLHATRHIMQGEGTACGNRKPTRDAGDGGADRKRVEIAA